jgi:hypothetical protein
VFTYRTKSFQLWRYKRVAKLLRFSILKLYLPDLESQHFDFASQPIAQSTTTGEMAENGSQAVEVPRKLWYVYLSKVYIS